MAENSLDGVLVDLNDVRKCVAFLTDSGFEAPCDIDHPLAWMLAILWECGATNEQIKGMFDWTCGAVERDEAATGAKMPAGDWGFCFCEVRTARGPRNGHICDGACPAADEGSALRADREGRLRVRF